MIADLILQFFTGISGLVLAPLTVVNIAVDVVTSIPVVLKFLTIVAYVVPWNNLIPIFVIIFGLLIPYMARRFAKFMPATPGYALYRLLWPVKRVKKEKRKQSISYNRLVKRYFMRSLGWAVITSALSYSAYICIPNIATGWYLALIWILLLLYEFLIFYFHTCSLVQYFL